MRNKSRQENVHDVATHGGYIRVRHNPHGRDEYIPLKANILGLSPHKKAALVARLNGTPLPPGDVGEFGRKLTTDNIKKVLEKMMTNNVALAKVGRSPVPICIWGSHGLGKTTIVRDICVEKDWAYAYVAPAQFEEMGDLHGFPVRTGVTDSQAAKGEIGTMSYFPPQWVPREVPKKAGVLLVDDFNRADPRILNGLMQLFQDGRLAGWALPEGFMIIATANPASSGDYSVAQLDPAQMTRMLHVELQFNMDAWKKWAETVMIEGPYKGQTRVDPRATKWMIAHGDQFLSQPERYQRTTPRSLDQLFTQIRPIKNWSVPGNEELVATYAYGALDKPTADNFMQFGVVPQSEEEQLILITPQELLFAETPLELTTVLTKFKNSVYDDEGNKKTDKLNATVEAIVDFIDQNADNVKSPYVMNFELVDQATPGDVSAMPLVEVKVRKSDLKDVEKFVNMLKESTLTSRGKLVGADDASPEIAIYDVEFAMPGIRHSIGLNLKSKPASATPNPGLRLRLGGMGTNRQKLFFPMMRRNAGVSDAEFAEAQKKVSAALNRKKMAARNFQAFLESDDVPAETVLKVVNHMVQRANVVMEPNSDVPLIDKFDKKNQGHIELQGPGLILGVGVIKKAYDPESLKAKTNRYRSRIRFER